jgi:hypothetical protein
MCAIGWALFGAIAACAGRDEPIVKITRDAAAPEITTCTPATFPQEDMGVDLLVIVDRSGPFGSDDWTWMTFALTSVFGNPEFGGINVALRSYPENAPLTASCIEICGATPTCGCLQRECDCDDATPVPEGGCKCDWRTACDAAYYPPDVEMSPLHDGLQVARFPALREVVGWPAMSPALLGSLRYRNQWEAEHPGRHITQLLIAGTNFDSCEDEDNFNNFEASEDILSGPGKPKTYVATYNETESDYDDLAMAGRTEVATRMRPPPRPLPPGPPTVALTDLFRKIRNAEGRCEYLLPERVDYRSVNLTSAADGTLYRRVEDAAGCVRNPQGWYYDKSIAQGPTRILTCPETCKSLHSATGQATANLQIGCPTVTSDGGI